VKLCYALWGDGLGPVLLGPEFRAALAAAGATMLQVNVDDADVAAAKLRITTFDTPVSALVSVWTGGNHEGISAVVAGAGAAGAGAVRAAARSAGWEVEERVPLAPPVTPDGERWPALAQVGFLRIPADLDEREWRHRWQGSHTNVAIATQATFGYIQNRVLRTIMGSDRVDAVVEELFPMAAISDIHAFYGSGGDDAELRRRLGLMLESVTRFGAHENLDIVPTSRYVWTLAAG